MEGLYSTVPLISKPWTTNERCKRKRQRCFDQKATVSIHRPESRCEVGDIFELERHVDRA